MNILSAKYANKDGAIIEVVTDDGKLYVPEAEDNGDYKALATWVKNGGKIEPYEVDTLNDKEQLKKLIDEQAENERLKYITNGVGQSMTYQEKVNQAAAYSKAYAANKADPKNVPEPTADEYSLLASSLGIDGNTLLEVAETVTYAYAQWQQIGAIIETIRLQSKAAIDDAETAEDAQAVFDAVAWPSV